jgi:nucleoside-diphosphate-sugar epimerase
VLRTLQNILRKPIDPTFGPTREGDVRDSQADIHKARQMLGYEPRMPLEDGLRQTVEWYQNNAAARTRS